MFQNIVAISLRVTRFGKKQVERVAGRKRIIFAHLALVDGHGARRRGKNAHRILRRNPEERPHRSPRSTFGGGGGEVWGNVKLDFEDGVFLDWIHPDQVMNSRIP